jgi:hypothetical protein
MQGSPLEKGRENIRKRTLNSYAFYEIVLIRVEKWARASDEKNQTPVMGRALKAGEASCLFRTFTKMRKQIR